MKQAEKERTRDEVKLLREGYLHACQTVEDLGYNCAARAKAAFPMPRKRVTTMNGVVYQYNKTTNKLEIVIDAGRTVDSAHDAADIRLLASLLDADEE